MNARQLEAAWSGKTARQTKQRMDIKFWMLRESPMTPNDGRMILEVSGVPFDDSGKAMRSKLKSLGFWFERSKKNWIIDSGSPTEYNLEKNSKWSKHRANQKKAFPIVKQMATEYNRTVADPHNEALKKLAPGKPTGSKAIVKDVLSRGRRESWLQSAGIEYKARFPSGNYDFFEAYVSFSGNTYHIKDILKSFGFKWNGSSKSWVMPYVEWSIVEDKFFATAGKHIQRMVRQPAQPAQGVFETMSKQELGALVLRFFKKTDRDYTNPFQEWFEPQDEADRPVSTLYQVQNVSEYLKKQTPAVQQKMNDAMTKGDGDKMYRLLNSNRYASEAALASKWFWEPAPTAAVKNAFTPPADMADAVSNYFRKTRMNAKDMLRNFSKSPESVIKMLELALKQTGWAKMWWPKKPQDWLAFLKQVA